MQGQILEVLGWTHRNESLHLTLVLPDGTRSFIPAEWTDLDIPDTQNRQSTNRRPTKEVLGSICHFLHVRKMVDALMCKMDSSKHVHTNTSKEENKRRTPPVSCQSFINKNPETIPIYELDPVCSADRRLDGKRRTQTKGG